MRIEQEKIPSADRFVDKYNFYEKWDDSINWKNI